jgi:hypothetical protein
MKWLLEGLTRYDQDLIALNEIFLYMATWYLTDLKSGICYGFDEKVTR